MQELVSRKSEFKLRFTDHILDNIYGQVGLTKLEKELERLPIFKRLHDISQLGLTNIVFPCALHNRYVHSIGVMHMASEMATHINANMCEPFFNDNDIQIIRLAGLLHDIGHYPMSHNIESSYMYIKKRSDVKDMHMEDILKHYTNLPDELRTIFVSGNEKKNAIKKEEADSIAISKPFHHERIGSEIIKNNKEIHKIVKENFVLFEGGLNRYFSEKDKESYTEDEIDEITNNLLVVIGEIIVGNYGCLLDEKYIWASKYSAMVQIIHSDLDADNIDYLLRDATFSGTTYGILDISVLLNSLIVTKLKMKNKRKYIIGVKKKGIGSVDQFLFNKFFAYKQMIFTKYVSILEAMLFHIEYELVADDDDYSPEKILKYTKDENTRDEYLKFTDPYIKNQLYEYKNRTKQNSLENIICDKLLKKTAFDCDDSSVCICTLNDVNKIVKTFEKNECVQELKMVINRINEEKKEGLTFDEQKQLFAYRFEKHVLTKQVKYKDFKKTLEHEPYPFYKAQKMYERLANGIPVIDAKKKYYIDMRENNLKQFNIPKLCVDLQESLLYDNCNLVYISLRKYFVC